MAQAFSHRKDTQDAKILRVTLRLKSSMQWMI
jgi:hypothetical protein